MTALFQQLIREQLLRDKAEEALSNAVLQKRLKVQDKGADQETVTVTRFVTTADFEFDTLKTQGERSLWVHFRVPGTVDVGYRLLDGDSSEATGTKDIVCDGYMSIDLPFGDVSPANADVIANGCVCAVPINQLGISDA